MLQGLEAADGDAELLARLHVVDGELVQRGHGADRLGGERRDRRVDDALDQGIRRARRADHGVGGDAHAGERDLGGAHAVDGRVAAASKRLGAAASTRNSASPSRSRWPPESRAETTKLSALSPCSTRLLSPSST